MSKKTRPSYITDNSEEEDNPAVIENELNGNAGDVVIEDCDVSQEVIENNSIAEIPGNVSYDNSDDDDMELIVDEVI
jgi:hypothetical protein